MKLLKIAKLYFSAIKAEWKSSKTAGCNLFGQENSLFLTWRIMMMPSWRHLPVFSAIVNNPQDVEIFVYEDFYSLRRLCSLAEYRREDWCFAPDEGILVWNDHCIPVYWLMDDTWYIPLPDMSDVNY